jgi:hypothetical protein
MIETAERPPVFRTAEHTLGVSVVFTSIRETMAALRTAAALAGNLNARVTLLVPQIVPYPRPLDSPPIAADFSERRLSLVASGSPVETIVRILLGRDRLEMLLTTLTPHSLLVIGGRRRRWPTREKRLAARLRRAGHDVILTETE